MPGKAGDLVGGRYRLDELVGHGGMARVWRSRDTTLNRDVAIKEIDLQSQLPEKHAELIKRMRREGEAAAKLDHSGIITIYDMVEDGGRPWIVMELADGPSLDDELKNNGPLPWRRAAVIAAQIASGLVEAHEAGIVHRDLKPANILLLPKRGAVIIDFGIAQLIDATDLTRTGESVGTLRYMAPEQLSGKKVGPPADLWSLGATLYAAVEGHPPFGEDEMVPLIAAIATREPAPPVQAGRLGPLISQLLAKSPAGRPTAEDVGRLIAEILAADAGDPAPIAPTSPDRVVAPSGGAGSKVGREGTRWPRIAAVVMAVMVLAAGGTIIALSITHKPPPPPASLVVPAGCLAQFGGMKRDELIGFVTSACFPHDKEMAAIATEITAENNNVLASNKPYRTVVFFGQMTNAGSTTPNVTSLYGLRGAYYAQRQNNVSNKKFNVRILLANAGDQFDDYFDNGRTVADLITEQAKKDHSIMSVIGIGQSRTYAEDAVQTLGEAGLPVIGSSVTGTAMFSSPNFFSISPEDPAQAQLAAAFAKNDMKAKTALILANQNSFIKGPNKDFYSDELAGMFKDDFSAAGGKVLDTCDYPEQASSFKANCGDGPLTIQGLLDFICQKSPSMIFFAGRAVTLPLLFTASGGCRLPPVLGSTDVPKYASSSAALQTMIDQGKATLDYISFAPSREGGCSSAAVTKRLYQTSAMCAFIADYRGTYKGEELNGPTGNPDDSPGLSYDSSDAMMGDDALQAVVEIIGNSGSNPDIDGAEALKELDSGNISFDGASGYVSFSARQQNPPDHPMYITSLGSTLTIRVSCGQVSGGQGGPAVVQQNNDCPAAS